MIRMRITRVRRRIILTSGFVLFICFVWFMVQAPSRPFQDVIKMPPMAPPKSPPSFETEELNFDPIPPICRPEDKYDQLEPCLIHFVKTTLLVPPPHPPHVPLMENDTASKSEAVGEKLAFIRKHLIEKDPRRPGFFIECGATDGNFISSTWPLERDHNWTGVLIEANPLPFQILVLRRRNVWAINVALCVTTHSDQVTFFSSPYHLASAGLQRRKGLNQRFNLTCIPLYTILAALEVSTVDYLSLDVEGSDLDVLKTVPFDMVIFKVLTVEHAHVTGFQMAVVEFLETKGYKFIGTLIDTFTQDSLFVHESIYTADMALKIKFQESQPSFSFNE